jgi:CheY-like chemotaxis protein
MAAQLQDSYASLERKVDERTRQLELANLAKSRFLAAASHDLRQPVQALGLFVEQLHGHMKSAEGGRLAKRIDAAVAAMNELFNALLDISKLDAGVLSAEIAEFPVAQVLKRIENTFAAAAREKELSFRLVPGSAWVRSDPILLERIVLNLVSNAIRYTAVGGVVVGCRRRGETVRIEVWDSGPGIPEDQRRNIFGEFYRLAGRNPHGGLGLGLAIIDRLCSLLGHPVELVSTVGKGSRFSITVPLAAAQAIFIEAQDTPPLAAEMLTGKLVVVIDDDPLVLDGMGGLLRNWGCRVVTAASPEVIPPALDGQDVPDLIISDIVSPMDIRASTRSTTCACRAERRSRLSSSAEIPRRSGCEAQQSGHHLLHKPVRPMKLRAMLHQLLKNSPVAGAA